MRFPDGSWLGGLAGIRRTQLSVVNRRDGLSGGRERLVDIYLQNHAVSHRATNAAASTHSLSGVGSAPSS